MRGILFLAIVFAASACQSQIPHGTGPIALQPNVQLSFLRHLDRREPIVFLISADGTSAYGTYCTHRRCEFDPLYIRTELRCAELTGKPCKVFAETGTITWKGPVAIASPGEGSIAGATVDWGDTGTLYSLRIDGLAGGSGTFSGKIRERACAGAIDTRSLSWRLECGADLQAHGSLSKAGAGLWAGFGWSDKNAPVRLFVAGDIARGRAINARVGGSPAFPDQPPTFEAAAPPSAHDPDP